MQSKYGMMRDENEGYSKLIVEVLQCTNDESSETCIHNLFSLIGYFDLDPDRVVDLVLECWVQAPLNLSYLAILRQFKQASLAHFLGKRFEHLLSSTGNAAHHFGSQPTQLENAY
jgi:THO complex subunit 2